MSHEPSGMLFVCGCLLFILSIFFIKGSVVMSLKHTLSLCWVRTHLTRHPTFSRRKMVSLDINFCRCYLIGTEIEVIFFAFQTNRNSHGCKFNLVSKLFSWVWIWNRDQLSYSSVIVCVVRLSLNIWAGCWKLWRAEYIEKYSVSHEVADMYTVK